MPAGERPGVELSEGQGTEIRVSLSNPTYLIQYRVNGADDMMGKEETHA